MIKDLKEYILSRIVIDANGCWNYPFGLTQSGYPRIDFRLNKKSNRAHRVCYELFKGEIPQGLVLDHLCRNKICINPDHLEPVTERTNILRGVGLAAQNIKKTHCKYGHEFSGDNLRIFHRNGRAERGCVACSKRNARQAYLRGKARYN